MLLDLRGVLRTSVLLQERFTFDTLSLTLPMIKIQPAFRPVFVR